jgi:hypothetical protein
MKRGGSTEQVLEIFLQRIYEYVFLWEFRFVLPVVSSSTLSSAYICPVSGSIASPGKSLLFDEGLENSWSVLVSLLPIFSSAFADHRQHF